MRWRAAHQSGGGRPGGITAALVSGLILAAVLAGPAYAQTKAASGAGTDTATTPKSGAQPPITCESQPGGRTHCAAKTSQGVTLVRSTGGAPCLLGKTWGYDDTGIWVSDGCSGAFVAGQVAQPPAATGAPRYVPNAGFLLFDGDKGQLYMRLFTYVRYLNQLGLDPTYVDHFGVTQQVQRRQDIQLTKFFLPFSGWFLTPQFRFYLYVWSANTSQGLPAQVVGGGNISWTFNRFLTLGGGIFALPTTRSTEGQFPYWLGVDDRLTSDEFFRGSYTQGIFAKGQLAAGLSYSAGLANNLSTLGVDAGQLDNKLGTQSIAVVWLPSTREFGLYGTYGDYENHQMIATRLGVHYTHSLEDAQSQPGTESIDNTQIRLTDGSVIFTPDLFGPGITVNKLDYQMMSVDGGIKYHGLALEGEFYSRWLDNYRGMNTTGLHAINDVGYQMQSSAMAVQKLVQVYVSGAQMFGSYGNPAEVRSGANWYVIGQRGLRLNLEWIHLVKCPVGYLAVPYPVGGNGNLYSLTFEMQF
jgi:hypothetical protein